MTAEEKRAGVVKLLQARIKKNRYTQGSKRDRVFEEPAGWGDCSSTIREGFKKALGIDIGANTAMQIVSKKGRDIDIGNGAIYPNESKLLPGDCLYFKGTDTSRPFSVGHVEMYIGNGQLLGHGSGIGPTIKRLQTYCKGRHTSGKGYIKTRRFILDDQEERIYPANPMDVQGRCLTVAGHTVNLRSGPSMDYAILGTASKGDTFKLAASEGWVPVQYKGGIAWISERYIQ
jgi:hypothetical protein